MPDRMETEILVVGAGPAGLAAAVAASQNHLRVVLVDENPEAGGQIWRGMASQQSSPSANFLARLFEKNVQILSPVTVFDFDSEDTARISIQGGHGTIRFQKAILCPGARELFLPFPGWTLPGVLGVGGLQALVKQGLPIRGKQVVVAGSGPLLLAVAKHLRKESARIPAILEQAPPGGLRELFFALWRHPSKLRQAIGFYPTVAKVKPEWWVKRAIGQDRLNGVEATNGKSSRRIECDYLACAYGLVPNTELAQLAGCRIENGFVAVDEHQRTSIERIFCAGEPVAIGGAEAAIVQGTIAGLAAAGRIEEIARYDKERVQTADFAERLERAFALRKEVLSLAEPQTIVCRCEDVRYGELEDHASARAAKLHTRCGMGACQGRICGAACQRLFGWEAPTIRPPLVPVSLEAMVESYTDSQ